MKKTKSMCQGCRNNFYNGNNNLGVKGCWSFESAKVTKKKRVHRDQVPPWNQAAKTVLSCFHAEGYVFVGADQTC